MLLRVGFIALAMASASAFANFEEMTGTLKGGGHWASADGSKGTWSSVLTVAKADKALTIKEVLTIKSKDKEDHVEEMGWSLTPKENGFFDVSIGDRVSGWGHCFRNVCQINSEGKEPNSRWAETFKITKRGILRMGTEHMEKFQVSFFGISKKQ